MLGALRDVAALGVPTRCAGCGAHDRGVCASCEQLLWREVQPRRVPGLSVPVVAACSYGGITRRLLLAYKEQGRRELASHLGAVLGVAIGEALSSGKKGSTEALHGGTRAPSPLLPVGVPSTRATERARGFRHVEALIRSARRSGRRADLLPPGRLLTASAQRTDQVGLGRAARWVNAERVAVRRGVSSACVPSGVFLVDDVLTTGASLSAAVARLQSENFRVVFGVVLCVTSESFLKQ